MITIRSTRIMTIMRSGPTIMIWMLLLITLVPSIASAADFPQADISNGLITAKIYLPDAENGYYRSTRFDWSGAVYNLQYEGHEFYGPWYERIDPEVINLTFEGSNIVAGPCSAFMGLANEFEIPLGWDDAEPGGTFVKIGVGVLRRGEGRYNRFVPYDVLNSGVWTVDRTRDAVEVTQELSDPTTGYAYLYRKTIRLVESKPILEIDHSLTNTGRLAIHSNVYNHNFVMIDKQVSGPDYTIELPFEIQGDEFIEGPPEVSGNRIVFTRPLTGDDESVILVSGFGESPDDGDIIIENEKLGVGMKITGNRPVTRELMWAVRTVLAVEPYFAVDIEPGDECTWKNTIEYYTLDEAE